MLVLLDHSAPAPLRYALKGHVVLEAVERGWERLGNGALLEAAEAAGYEVFVTADKNTAFSRIWSIEKSPLSRLGMLNGERPESAAISQLSAASAFPA